MGEKKRNVGWCVHLAVVTGSGKLISIAEFRVRNVCVVTEGSLDVSGTRRA